MKKSNLMKRGFTLIEVVIVLAIAALIMVVVFIAVTGAQRSQRDQVRQNIVNRAKAQMEQAKGNGGGTYPTDGLVFANTYLGATSGAIVDQGITITATNAAPAANASACSTTDNGLTTSTAGILRVTGTATGGSVGTCLESRVWYTLTYP